ncbi:hypothetical protein PG996_015749 [Apiospora saccharicola]|uniref:Uncharacterized protein n=1 Tax=Apiospora saccharicola TaxID=335842 RepID=A0ABR1TM15_9PEZI
MDTDTQDLERSTWRESKLAVFPGDLGSWHRISTSDASNQAPPPPPDRPNAVTSRNRHARYKPQYWGAIWESLSSSFPLRMLHGPDALRKPAQEIILGVASKNSSNS